LKVSLSVGRMTEAIEDALQFAFEALTDRDPLYEGAQLEITMVEPKSRCVECGTVYEHDRFHVSCPECGGFGELIAGKELRIDSIEVDLPDADDADDELDAMRDDASSS
ncbi:MAG: hydrogenase maturation nickel metallochaperone HypA, partial [Slackia piriformis]|nr:hydrogenase maturation nickel metallochaperone HypA [Slackia piriformis]